METSVSHGVLEMYQHRAAHDCLSKTKNQACLTCFLEATILKPDLNQNLPSSVGALRAQSTDVFIILAHHLETPRAGASTTPGRLFVTVATLEEDFSTIPGKPHQRKYGNTVNLEAVAPALKGFFNVDRHPNHLRPRQQ